MFLVLVLGGGGGVHIVLFQNVPFTRDAEMSYQQGLMSLSKGTPVSYDSTFRIVTHDGGRALLQESQQTRKHPVRQSYYVSLSLSLEKTDLTHL